MEQGAEGTVGGRGSSGHEAAQALLPLDYAGHVPAVPEPRASLEDVEFVSDTPLARLVLGRARVRTAIPLDEVSFTAACPGCGTDCTWTQTRQDTRVRSVVDCPCG